VAARFLWSWFMSTTFCDRQRMGNDVKRFISRFRLSRSHVIAPHQTRIVAMPFAAPHASLFATLVAAVAGWSTLVATTPLAVAQIPAAVADRLPPPKSVELPPLPSSSGPTTTIRRGSDLPRPHLWTLPSGETPRAPVALPTDSIRKPWRHLGGEPLSLAVEPVPSTPTTPVFPTAVPARVLDGAAWSGTPALSRFERLAEPAPRAQDDATSLPAFGFLTRPVATAVPVPPPLAPVLLVDPDAPRRAAAVSNPPPDTDRPAISRETPPRPQFPAK
jgi:hypothetical protein